MDNLDQLLREAWNRISARLRRKRRSALKRSRRRFKGVLTRPMREWCLVIRASDPRINPCTCDVELAEGLPHWFNSTEQAVRGGHPHTITIDGTLIRRLTAPVKIPYPGVTCEEAARLCGREWKTMRTWVREAAHRGMFRIDYYREKGFDEHTTRSKPLSRLGEIGRGGRPYVWTPSPIDPNAWTGRTPHVIFGTLWQWLWEGFPEKYVLTVKREPRQHACRGKRVFRGWEFICPGLLDARGEHSGCGNRCTHLFAPQTVWTLAKSIGDGEGEGFDVAEKSAPPRSLRLAGQWFPGLADTVAQPGTRTFACRKCWRVRNTCFSDHSGWNEFVTHISGGLLYGHDVPRPLDLCPMVRKKRPSTRKAMHRVRSGQAAAAVVSNS